MRRSIIFLLVPLILIGAELKIGESRIEYNLSTKWKSFHADSSEGIKVIGFKREGIIDRKGIKVIPNLLIKIFKVVPNESYIDNPDTNLFALDMMTRVVLMNDAPPIVLKEYKESKCKEKKFKLNHELSYNFISNYKDDFDEIHDCYYVTLMVPNKTGALIIIDTTHEVFQKIIPEIEQFLSTLKLY
jgi:hypothetical protein